MMPRILSIFALILGLGLFAYSLTLPYYKNQKAADDLISNEAGLGKEQYYIKEAELRTSKLTLMDLGSGLAIASGTILLFLVFTKTKIFSDFKRLKSFNTLTIFISSNLAWLLLIPGTYWYYWFRGGRGDYPPFADSIGIPIMEQTTGLLWLLIPLNVFLILTTINANLPCTIFVKAHKYNTASVLWEIFFGFFLLVNIFAFVTFVDDGDHFSIVINLFFAFILLTLRAGQISRYVQAEENAVQL